MKTMCDYVLQVDTNHNIFMLTNKLITDNDNYMYCETE